MYLSNKPKLNIISYNYQIKKYLFFSLHSHRAPVKPIGQIHRIFVLLELHVPPFKHTFELHDKPKSILKEMNYFYYENIINNIHIEQS
jgi:hypothetical protein